MVNKKVFKKIGLSSFLAFIPLVAASCTTVPSANLINNSIFVTNQANVTSFLELKPIAKTALKTNGGLRNYATDLANNFLLDWLNKAANINSTFKTRLDLQKANIDKKIAEEKADKEKEFGNNFLLKWQQDILDLHGGSEESYKNEELISYARSEFSNNVLTNLFLSVFNKKTNQPVLNPNPVQIADALCGYLKINKQQPRAMNDEEYTFAIDPKIVLTSNENTDVQYADFQRFLIQKYFEYEAPFVFNQVGWNYGQNVRTELESIYNQQLLTNNSTQATEANNNTNIVNGTYEFPYFSSTNNTNNASSTTDKFKAFVNEAKKTANFISSDEKLKSLGIKNISNKFSDLTSSLALAKTSNLFIANNANVANALAYLFGVKENMSIPGVGVVPGAGVGGPAAAAAASTNNSDELINNIDKNLTKEVKLENSDLSSLDIITSNFVSKTTKPISDNGTQNPILKLPKEFTSKVFNSTQTNLYNQELYVLDNFIPSTSMSNPKQRSSDTNGLSQFMLVRDDAGVKALSIEGSEVIKKGSSLKQRREKAFGYVLYYHFLNQVDNVNNSFNVNLKTELTSFLTSNLDWLVIEYINNNNNKIDFLNPNNSTLNADLVWYDSNKLGEKEKALVKLTSKYLADLTFYNAVNAANEANLNNKKTFANRYFNDAARNGLAANFNYEKLSDKNPTALKPVSVLKTASNPAIPFNKENRSSSTSLHQQVLKAVEEFIDSDEIVNLSLNNPYFQYSQRLATNNASVNKAIDNFLSNQELVKNYVTLQIVQPLLDNKFNFSDLSFKMNGQSTNLDQAFYNWYLYDKLNVNSSLFSTNLDISKPEEFKMVSDFSTYAKSLVQYQNSLDYANEINNFSSISKLALISIDQTNKNLEDLLAYLKTTIGNEKAYFVWNVNVDGTITKKAKDAKNGSEQAAGGMARAITSPSGSSSIYKNVDINARNNLLKGENSKVLFDINNNNFSYYYGNYSDNSNCINLDPNNLGKNHWYTNNNFSKPFRYINYGTNGNTKLLDNFIGFLYSSNTTGLDENANQILFGNNQYKTTLLGQNKSRLFEYENKQNLAKLIDETNNLSDLTALANSIDQKTNNTYLIALQLKRFDQNSLLDLIKDEFKKLINGINDTEFDPIKGFLGTNTQEGFEKAYKLNQASNDINTTFVISIKPNDLNSFDTFKNAIKDIKVEESNMNLNADQLVNNLLMQFSLDNNFLNTIFPSLIASSKIVTNDRRIYDSFNVEEGRIYIANYKVLDSQNSIPSTTTPVSSSNEAK